MMVWHNFQSINVVFLLTHLYHHFFGEGIGMRPVIDCYFVMNGFPTTPSLLHKEGSTSFPKPLSPQGTGDVAGGAMALPGFLYRQRSSRPQGAADDCLTPNRRLFVRCCTAL